MKLRFVVCEVSGDPIETTAFHEDDHQWVIGMMTYRARRGDLIYEHRCRAGEPVLSIGSVIEVDVG